MFGHVTLTDQSQNVISDLWLARYNGSTLVASWERRR